MEYVVRCVFTQPENAQAALDEMIRLGISPHQIAFRARYADETERGEDQSLSVDSELQGALLTERIMASPSATGFNLAGNSTLSGTSLGDIGQILAEVAGVQTRPATVRIDAMVRTPHRRAAKTVEHVLQRYGGDKVRATHSIH